MKIHEYQAKAILREFGVPVPAGDVADTPAAARAIAQELGFDPLWWELTQLPMILGVSQALHEPALFH